MQPSDEMIERIARSICHSDHPCWSIVAEIMCQPSYQPGFEGDAGSITQAGRYRQHAEAAHHALTAALPPEGDDAELVERLRQTVFAEPAESQRLQLVAAEAADRLTAQAAEIAQLKQERDEARLSAQTTGDQLGQEIDRLIRRATAAEAKVEELTKENERLLSMLKRVPSAMSGYFVGGIEEREGGSARRQEKLMKDGDALLDEIRTALKEGS